MRFFDNFFVLLVFRIGILTVPYLFAVQAYDRQDQWGRAMLAAFTLFGMVIGAILYLLLFRPDMDDKYSVILYVSGFMYIAVLTLRYAALAGFIG